MKRFGGRLLSLLFVGIAPAVGATPPPSPGPASTAGMTRIPQGRLQLGSTLDEIMAATLQCTAERRGAPCVPGEFSIELSDDVEFSLPSFFLDRTEVSRAAYLRCVVVGVCRRQDEALTISALLQPNVPAVLVNYYDAETYCAYRGARLPTEAEFELAARGPERRVYPWGNLYHRRRSNAGTFTGTKTSDRDGFHLLAPTTAFTAGQTPQGVRNLAGNAEEWTSSPFSPHGGQQQSLEKVVKGGSFATPPVTHRAAARRGALPHERRADLGFRCARDILPKD